MTACLSFPWFSLRHISRLRRITLWEDLDGDRISRDGSAYTYRRQTFLTDVDVRSALREAIGMLRLTHPFVIEAWVLLPDHMHALWTLPPGDEDFSYRWRVIKRMVTQRCQSRLNRPEWMNARRKKRNQSTLWQHRFWEHLIRDEADFNRHIDTSIGTR